MCRQPFVLTVAAGLSLITSSVLAQCGCGSGQTSYAPVAPSCTTYYTPTYYTPTYYTPTYYTPTYCPPASNVTYYGPAIPQAAYYAPMSQRYTTCYAPAAQPYTTYYTPAARPYVPYYATAGKSIYGTPKVYVPGEPVRNVLRAITP